MQCISTMDRITLSADIVMNLIKLYKYNGKEFYYKDVFKPNYKKINDDTIEEDAFYLSKIFGVKLTDHKLKLIISKNATPKNKDEILVYNLKRSIEYIHKRTHDFTLNANEVIDMAKFMYKDYKEVVFNNTSGNSNINSLLNKKKLTSRDELEMLINKFNEMLRSEHYEFTLLVTNFYVDFINMNIFKKNNEEIGLMLIYCIMLKENLNLLRYASFFKVYYLKKDVIEKSIKQANFNWEDGFSQTHPLHTLLVTCLLEVYERIEKLLRDYTFDTSLNKGDDVENTILKLEGIFTKEHIRNKHPFVSDSTIDRTLKKLRDENVIKPLSTGRSAKWIKIAEPIKNDAFSKITQLGLFEGDFDE